MCNRCTLYFHKTPDSTLYPPCLCLRMLDLIPVMTSFTFTACLNWSFTWCLSGGQSRVKSHINKTSVSKKLYCISSQILHKTDNSWHPLLYALDYVFFNNHNPLKPFLSLWPLNRTGPATLCASQYIQTIKHTLKRKSQTPCKQTYMIMTHTVHTSWLGYCSLFSTLMYTNTCTYTTQHNCSAN